ncbi:preprotein translocase subunit YajC [Streptomyces sp. SID8382]|uniref:preprotein translocase subunit YajC n=1 Tax=Streptomyces malaysiensis TaxID=92644 RepID=UPI000C2BA6A8|nr:preprotein translocase subunit YajC [Streptomyces sp. M56]AUA10022.1 preprotein translocase subunit YajC [Streptomyces sp. M56]MYX59875.1 preprotein translocase subunit YajC [Streptomyces sp. SID8382]
MNIVTLLPFIVLIGAMFLMTRSAKNKQRQAQQMRNDMQPGSGVRTIGGMYATVKEVHDDTVLLEVAPGVHAIYAKNSVGAVLSDAEYNHIVHGIDPDDEDATDTPVVPDDASSLTESVDADGDSADKAVALEKTDALEKADTVEKADEAAEKTDAVEKADEADEADVKKIDLGKDDTVAAATSEDDKRDGGTDAK